MTLTIIFVFLLIGGMVWFGIRKNKGNQSKNNPLVQKEEKERGKPMP
jgi:hypothetical protein